MKGHFSREIRVLMCQQCAAPLEVAPGGGSSKCGYCGAVNQLVPRRRNEPLEHREMSEAERMGKLWAQAGKSIPPPDSVRGLLLGNGLLNPNRLDDALALFNSTRKELEVGLDFAASERLTFLALVLYNHYVKTDETRRQRAILESAVESLELPHHKQFVLGTLSRCAVKDEDPETAREWLEPCDPRSDDLRADTSYRVARALIDTADGMFDRVHKLLGDKHGEVPVADGYQALVAVLRANAWEKRGHVETARNQLVQFVTSGGVYGIDAVAMVAGIYPHLKLCEESMPSGNFPAGSMAASPRPRRGRAVGLVFLLLGLLLGGIGVFVDRDSLSLVSSGAKAQGTVIAMPARASSSTDRTVSYYPVVRFTTEDGQTIQYASNIGNSPPAYEVGETVEVLYDPADPQKAAINSFFQLWAATIIMGGIGALFVLIGFVMLLAGGRRRR